MAPDEICRRLGEARLKEMFLALNAASMKKALATAGIPAVRLPSHTSTRKRNEDWASKVSKAALAKEASATALLFDWLSQSRSEMLAAFLDSVGVAHNKGLTDDDFLSQVGDDKLIAAAQGLLSGGRFEPREVAVYLLFLDGTSKTQKFASLPLADHLPAASAPAA